MIRIVRPHRDNLKASTGRRATTVRTEGETTSESTALPSTSARSLGKQLTLDHVLAEQPNGLSDSPEPHTTL